MNLDFLQISLLAILQGLTEFLPISSSGHLLLPSILFGWTDQGLTFDVAVHLGSLLAVVIYFRRDIQRLTLAWFDSVAARQQSDDSRLAWLLIIATVPGGIAGLLASDLIEEYARSVVVVAITSIVFALLLLWSDRAKIKRDNKQKGLLELNWKSALFIGCAQVLALIPGTSRSGVTMMAGLFCQLTRGAAARFSFLMSIPIILASGLLQSFELYSAGSDGFQWLTLLYAATISGLVAFSCIHFFLQLIERVGFLPFVVYRIFLGTLLLLIFFT